MKSLFLAIVMLGCFTAKAQHTKRAKKILVGINFSPDYSHRTLKPADPNSPANVVKDIRDGIEKAKFGYTTGLTACINMTKYVALETGLQFSNKGYRTKNRNLVYENPASPSDPTQASFRYNYDYIGIPLSLKFSLGKGKARFVSGAGFTTNFLVSARQTANFTYADGTTQKKRQSSAYDFKRIDVSPMLSVGISYQLTNNLQISAEPTFRYGLLKIIDAPIAEHLWSAGLNLAVHHTIKRKK